MNEEAELDLDLSSETLLELSLSNLKNNVRRNFGPERDSRANRVNVINYEAVPSIGSKSLLIKARVRGEEKNHKTSIRFSNVTFGQQVQPGFIDIKAIDGTEIFIKQFTAAQTQAKVRCDCLDFYWRFATWNHGKSSLDGDPPPPYVKKTDSEPQNPNKVPGSCKHILKLVEFLRGERIIR